MKETWKDISGYEGLYMVSDMGRVLSMKYGKTRYLKPQNRSNGYFYVMLSKEGKTKRLYVHRLVASAFLPNPKNYPVINHRDENPLNNRVDNLEFCSVRYNNCYGKALEKRAAKRSKTVLQFDKENNFLRQWPSATEVQRTLGFKRSYIYQCCNGKCKSAYDFVWKYA